MSSVLAIRIIFGGAIATYISRKIYDYINDKPPTTPPSPLYKNLKIKDVKTSQEILYKKIDKYNYDYDNEHGNTLEFR
jgi:hypothetical protein